MVCLSSPPRSLSATRARQRPTPEEIDPIDPVGRNVVAVSPIDAHPHDAMDPMATRRMRVLAHAALVASACLAATGESRAVGGQFGVDDAAILDVGECQVETWAERDPGTRTLVHAGGGCRVQAVEIGVNADVNRATGQSSATVVGPQVKWSHAFDERTSAGVVALVGWRARSASYAGAALYVPATVRVAETVWVDANLGRDWFAHASATTRAGISVSWLPVPDWLLVGETYRQASANVGRAGVRWQPSHAFSIDLSHAHSDAARVGSWWTLGATWVFAP